MLCESAGGESVVTETGCEDGSTSFSIACAEGVVVLTELFDDGSIVTETFCIQEGALLEHIGDARLVSKTGDSSIGIINFAGLISGDIMLEAESAFEYDSVSTERNLDEGLIRSIVEKRLKP